MVLLCLIALAAATHAAAAPQITLIAEENPRGAVAHGLNALTRALSAKGVSVVRSSRIETNHAGIWIVAGRLESGSLAREIATARQFELPAKPESLMVRHTRWQNRDTLVVLGFDDRGLMYALLDIAERVRWAGDPSRPLSEVRDIHESPFVSQRALSIYTMHRASFEQRFFNEAYWERYFDMLAQNRFNSFVLIFGYENGGYFAPAYPYFFNLAEFPEVRVVDFGTAEQERYLRALKRMIALAHDRGLSFTVGLWDHIYRGGVQSGGVAGADPNRPIPGIVWGLTKTNLVAYSTAALAEFLRRFPEIDAVQFRMHSESGLKPGDEMREFWRDIYQVVKSSRPGLRFDARAKEFPDELIDLALDMGIHLRICTKYWAEQMGLPFHPTHINRQNQFDRRHGYADLLRYPQRYRMHWRLWNGGTTRILLWGSPDYVRRFAESTHLYEGDGFEVNEMLATKMEAQPHEQQPFDLLGPQYRYYDWEFERYWHFYQVFGRVAYNPTTPSDTWQREFERRFGREAAPHIERAIHQASWILPRIIASTFPYNRFPTTRGWVEKQRWEDLPAYASCEPSDTEQFLSFTEAARHQIDGRPSAKISPPANSAWFARVSREVLEAAAEAERRFAGTAEKEFRSTLTDLRILAQLALYHSHRIHAGFHYALFKQSQDLHALDDAIDREKQAIAAWEQIVKQAGDIYHEDLMMGLRSAGLSGHWKDELAALNQGLAALEEQRNALSSRVSNSLTLAHVPVRRMSSGEPITIRVTASSPAPIRSVRLAWRSPSGAFRSVPMQPKGGSRFTCVLPEPPARSFAAYFIEAEDAAGNVATYPVKGAEQPLIVRVTSDSAPPALIHSPVSRAVARQPLRIVARVHDPSGVQSVMLRYRPVTQFEDYRALEMQPTGRADEFEAVVPAEHVAPRWDFMYFFEVIDTHGNGKIYPDLEAEAPYVVVKLNR